MNMDVLPQYELLQHEWIDDIRSDGYLLRHRKSGARILALENDDENKVFNIAFRTIPQDSTGAPHITEHSVLCGSRKFPLKDPFVELAKGSLNTFLNAITYPDKTMYPVASCNDKDFCNLMDVYLDAVFYPAIYQKEEIFRQEGWSYQLENPEDEIQINGVVYNEMKGAFSSPEDVLEREIQNSLFPDNVYGVESGGDPACIPDLSYENFLAFHKKFYHPSNSYIYLYGNMDMEERLQWLDREYLSAFECAPVDSQIREQEPFRELRRIEKSYPVSEEDPLAENTYLSYNAVIGFGTDVRLSNAFAVLEYALLGAPGAELKQALLDAGIGKDILGDYSGGIYQPYFSIIAKNTEAEEADHFLNVIQSTLKKIAERGIDKKALLAGVNSMEFRFREADYGGFPKGLMYGIDVFDSWLYDDQKPFAYLKQLDVYSSLKKLADTRYFETLITDYLLDGRHSSLVILKPERGLTERTEKALAEKLHNMKESLSDAEIQEMINATARLRAFQETPDAPEQLLKLPVLSRSDIGKKAAPFQNKEYTRQGVKLLHHDVFTNGIAYVDLLFDISRVKPEDYGYLGLLKAVLGMVDTEHYGYGDLNNDINSNTGGISAGLSVFQMPGAAASGSGADAGKHGNISGKAADADLTADENTGKAADADLTAAADENPGKILPEEEDAPAAGYRAFFGLRSRVLYEKLPYAMEMCTEILTSRFDDDKRLYEILAKLKSRLSMMLASEGHHAAATRALSYFSGSVAFSEATGGITFYDLVEQLEKNFAGCKEQLKEKLRELMDALFCRERLFVSATSDPEGLEALWQPLLAFADRLPSSDAPAVPAVFSLEQKNEGFMTPGQVQYVARAGNFGKKGFTYTGTLRILKVLMSYGYLWENVRVKGGAYGCMCSFGRRGDGYFVSYRDPNLQKTSQVYEGIPAWLRQFDADEREMTKYIIGAISELDTPLTPQAKGSRSLNAWFSGITEEQVQSERDEILTAGPGQLRALAPLVQAILDEGAFCVVGSEAKIREAAGLFGSIRRLNGAAEEEE